MEIAMYLALVMGMIFIHADIKRQKEDLKDREENDDY